MSDTLPPSHVLNRDTDPQPERNGLRLYNAILDGIGLQLALDVAMETVGAAAALVSRVPISGPVGDDRGVIACRDVEIEESLALALWWNSVAGVRALAAMGDGGLIQHGRGRRVPPALRLAVTLILEVERHGFCAVTFWRPGKARELSPQETVLLAELSPHLARAVAAELRLAG